MIKFGVFLDPIYIPYSYTSFKAQALEAENLGYESLWVSDHLMRGEKPLIECFTALSAIASITDKVRVGSLVACNSYRQPSLLAKIAATLDVISNGRLEFGIGAGWNEEEYQAYGISFPDTKTRITQMREGVEIIHRMWTEEKPRFTGQYFQIKGAVCEPKPIQKPHPPITIGGGGEKLTLKVVAEYADRWNWCGGITEFANKLRILKAYCTRIERNYDELEKSWFGQVMICEASKELRRELKNLYLSEHLNIPRTLSFEDWYKTLKTNHLVGTAPECVAKIKQYVNLGVRHFMLIFLDSPDTRYMNLFTNKIRAHI